MSRRKRPQPERGSPHERHLRDIVDELVREESQKAAYLAFARELALAQMRQPAKTGDSPMERSARGTVPVFAVPDYSAWTKRVVEKWFRRGLHGKLLWLIGQAVLEGRMP